jgi:hypothetical protein
MQCQPQACGSDDNRVRTTTNWCAADGCVSRRWCEGACRNQAILKRLAQHVLRSGSQGRGHGIVSHTQQDRFLLHRSLPAPPFLASLFGEGRAWRRRERVVGASKAMLLARAGWGSVGGGTRLVLASGGAEPRLRIRRRTARFHLMQACCFFGTRCGRRPAGRCCCAAACGRDCTAPRSVGSAASSAWEVERGWKLGGDLGAPGVGKREDGGCLGSTWLPAFRLLGAAGAPCCARGPLSHPSRLCCWRCACSGAFWVCRECMRCLPLGAATPSCCMVALGLCLRPVGCLAFIKGSCCDASCCCPSVGWEVTARVTWLQQIGWGEQRRSCWCHLIFNGDNVCSAWVTARRVAESASLDPPSRPCNVASWSVDSDTKAERVLAARQLYAGGLPLRNVHVSVHARAVSAYDVPCREWYHLHDHEAGPQNKPSHKARCLVPLNLHW